MRRASDPKHPEKGKGPRPALMITPASILIVLLTILMIIAFWLLR